MSQAELKHLTSYDSNGKRVIRLTDRKYIDDTQIRETGEEMSNQVESGVCSYVIDFSGVDFMASTMLGKLITLNRKCESEGSETITLCGIKREIYEVFAITKLNKLFTFKTLEEALES